MPVFYTVKLSICFIFRLLNLHIPNGCRLLEAIILFSSARYLILLTLLFLRGPQTAGEMRGRSDRLQSFDTVAEAEDLLCILEGEADDALASAAHLASADAHVEKVAIWTPDKDLSQCVRGDRIVQVDRRTQKMRNADGVREKFGVDPVLIPDLLALIGVAADGFPGIAGIGPITAARLLNRHGMIENFPSAVLGDNLELALLFKNLATLRTDACLFRDIDELCWRGPTDGFAACVQHLGDARLLERCLKAESMISIADLA